MKQSTSIYLSDKDKKRMERLLEIYEVRSMSELIRILVEKETERINYYKELNMQ